MKEVLRQEKKYLMNLIEARRLRALLEQVMIADPHNGTNGYMIRSLYFDTLNDRDYFEKIEGVELRRKIRLRIYNPKADFAMLEMKQKQGAYQKKRSLRISREDAQELIRCRYSVLLGYRSDFAAECFGVMSEQCYRPRTIVQYNRTAFIANENKIRVTIDSQLRATESSEKLFSPALNLYPVLDPYNGALEVKFNGFLLSYIKDLLERADRSELSISKYCLARSAGMKFGI